MTQQNSELDRAQKEISRLVKNRGALFDIMSDMVFLIRSDFGIEYMNGAAIATFGDLCGRTCYQALDGRDKPCAVCPVKDSLAGKGSKDLFERQIGEIHVEYNYVAFQGYKDEQLVMIVMRDISQRKRHEAELSRFNNDIETVLEQKIGDLKESERVRQELAQEVNVLKRDLERIRTQQVEMVGNSRKIRDLWEMINHVADSDATILITGESGTGKELVADVVHRRSHRKSKPFLKFNCAAVSESLLESDLFGYEKGAFTGAAARRMGKFEIASGGTIFLDEIGDISPRMQAALLRVLQNGEIVRVGGNEAVKTDVRVIAATNMELSTAVEENRFRRDLYYRLNVINLHQPALRERPEDILPLITHFIKKYRAAFNKEIDYLPNQILDRLTNYHWPGNIRELENVIKRAVLLAKNNVITEKELCFLENIPRDTAKAEAPTLMEKRMLEQPLKDTLAELEGKVLAGALEKYDGNAQVVVRMLGLSKTTFYEKVKRYGLAIPRKSD